MAKLNLWGFKGTLKLKPGSVPTIVKPGPGVRHKNKTETLPSSYNDIKSSVRVGQLLLGIRIRSKLEGVIGGLIPKVEWLLFVSLNHICF